MKDYRSVFVEFRVPLDQLGQRRTQPHAERAVRVALSVMPLPALHDYRIRRSVPCVSDRLLAKVIDQLGRHVWEAALEGAVGS